jgi:hypothetical protein
MADQARALTISRDDIENVAGKLAAWADTLPEHEQDVLAWILNGGLDESDDDTAGHVLGATVLVDGAPATGPVSWRTFYPEA